VLTPDERIVLDMLADPEAYTRSLRRTHEAVLSGRPAPGPLRSVIADSWRRSLAAKVDPDVTQAPQLYPSATVRRIRDKHPLAVAVPLLQQTLVSIAEKADHILIVTDSVGVILWCEGSRSVRRAAEDFGLVEGASCAEDAIGTNAMGTALAVDAPVQIHSAEHLVRTLHSWTCAASPVHDPETGDIVGVIDISGPVASAHPSSAVLVSATAELVEHQLRIQLAKREGHLRALNMPHLQQLRGEGGALISPSGRVLATEGTAPLPTRISVNDSHIRLSDGREGVLEPLAEGYLLRIPHKQPEAELPSISMSFLGTEPSSVIVNGQHVPLTDRHAEILALLALYPAGLTCEQLTYHLYGDGGSQATTRSEIHRLRNQLDDGVLRPRPYRLNARVSADFLAVHEALRDGDLRRALRSYRGALLPRSESPTLRAERDELHAAIRRGVLDSRDADGLWMLASTDLGHEDIELLNAVHRALPPNDPRRTIADARVNRLLSEE
jgi:hypothetical protein